MLAATKVKMSGSEKTEWTGTQTFSPKNVLIGGSKKFHVLVVQNIGKEMYKKVCCMSKVAFFAN